VYFDLIDNTNNLFEPWDRVGGATISQMYQVFNSRPADICQFRDEFINRYPQFNRADIRALFAAYNISCR